MTAERWGLAAAAALAATLALFADGALDRAVQDLLFDPASGRWLLDKGEPIGRFILYDGIKRAIVALGIFCLGALALSRWWGWARRRRRALLVAALSLALVPAIANGLKGATNIACPGNLIRYGGPIVETGLFEAYPPDARPDGRQRCFPAGHASGGFALLGLILLVEGAAARRAVAAGALALGSAMGAYKMAIGDHFLSHTLVSAELAVMIVAGLVVATRRWGPREAA